MSFENLIIDKNKTVLDALKQLNNIRYVSDVSRLILFVVNEDQKVIGSVTDGDIRRSLIEEADLSRKLDKICNRNFVFEYQQDGHLTLGEYRKRDLRILPILDKNKRLLEVIDLEKIKAVLPLECMIMAGGRGKRLSPLTDSVPKPMLKLGEKPIIEHNIDRLVAYGIKKFYISVKYLGEQIEDYFGDGSEKGVTIEYVWEDEPLGTAGALSLVNKFNQDILLINSDLFTNVDFEELYLRLVNSQADMAIASTEYKIDVPYAVLETKNAEILKFKEKPSYVYHCNGGIYILKKELVTMIPRNEFYDITQLMERLLEEKRKLVHSPIRGYWIDIGKPIDYEQAQEFIKHSN